MPKADLVLDGGGVKGTGLVGAVSALVERDEPYVFERIAGTSAGAIVGSMLAADLGPDEIKKLMFDLDFTQFEDEPALFDHARHLGAVLGLFLREGRHRASARRLPRWWPSRHARSLSTRRGSARPISH